MTAVKALLLSLAVASAAPSHAAPRDDGAEGCFDLSKDDGALTLSGALSDEGTAKGRAPFTMEMSASICVRGVKGANPAKRTDAIHIRPPADLLPVLRALPGTTVTLTGKVTVKTKPDTVTPLTMELREIHVVAEDYQIAG
ncbi:hypothetical protein IC614_10945 [Allosphingosinicella flava]|uniref:DUF4431 domain-containing protein n=1 Tax=Allosphingosinicella flava TaxID=2771430 RepID=A0A7T2GJ45_9SPHN|nr:hypothetical protein [Sphingosinicella flava]QPQ54826.1 hypothetical protein IC614_10945 [Sphingosinicella flava]